MKQARWLLVALAIVASVVAVFPRTAEAQGRRGPRGAIVVTRGFYGGPFAYGYGYGWPYGYGFGWPYYGFDMGYGPFGVPYAQGHALGVAAAAGLGGVDLNVKPSSAEVWVDGKFRGEARDLDGDSNLLWLKEGTHEVVIYKGGYRSFNETIAVEPGQKLDLKVRMEKGDSQPPGSRPGAKAKTTS